MIRKHFAPEYIYGCLAAIGWCLVFLGFPTASLFAVMATFATLDYIHNG